MLKRLRRKFVLVIMVIVALLFATVFGFVLHQTKQNLERESIQMMRTLVFRPHDAAMGRRPDEKPSGRPDEKPDRKPDGEGQIRMLFLRCSFRQRAKSLKRAAMIPISPILIC